MIIDEVEFTVEQGKLQEFVRAVGGTWDGASVPLTFVVVAGHWRDQAAMLRTLGLDIRPDLASDLPTTTNVSGTDAPSPAFTDGADELLQLALLDGELNLVDDHRAGPLARTSARSGQATRSSSRRRRSSESPRSEHAPCSVTIQSTSLRAGSLTGPPSISTIRADGERDGSPRVAGRGRPQGSEPPRQNQPISNPRSTDLAREVDLDRTVDRRRGPTSASVVASWV